MLFNYAFPFFFDIILYSVVMILCKAYVAGWSPFGKELRIRVTISALCYVFFCFGCFPIMFRGCALGSDCTNSYPWLTFYFVFVCVMFFFSCSFSSVIT